MRLLKKKTKAKEKPPYLERIDELENVNIVRLKGKIDQSMVPVIEARIQENRKREGIKIEKNVIIDYANVEGVDTATVAFHLVHLKEFEANGRKIGFINASDRLRALLDMFKETEAFKIYSSEEEAVNALNN